MKLVQHNFLASSPTVEKLIQRRPKRLTWSLLDCTLIGDSITAAAPALPSRRHHCCEQNTMSSDSDSSGSSSDGQDSFNESDFDDIDLDDIKELDVHAQIALLDKQAEDCDEAVRVAIAVALVTTALTAANAHRATR